MSPSADQDTTSGGGDTPDAERAEDTPQDLSVMRLNLGGAGMFGSVNTAVGFAHLAEQDGRKLVATWPDSVYRDKMFGKTDPWAYYFQPLFDGVHWVKGMANARLHYPDTVLTEDHPICPRYRHGLRDALALPKDRHLGGELLKKFVRPKLITRAFFNDFAQAFFNGPVIGLHLRGPGRLDGGAARLRQLIDPANPVPYEHYFYAVDKALRGKPKAKVFCCSDSLEVIRKCREQWGDRVLVYPASRSEFGEMHDSHEKNAGKVFSPYKLGIDIIAEAHLLAKCSHFVHGNSNVANYVLCRAPNLENTYVYERVDRQYRTEVDALQAAGVIS
ncbi:hypothetical protein [Maritimibacter sp. UBA3975]|uniref:hypothetical protein n=1 Tax=Maritimibacter sp. UBA3975 TaxID=1946833 RepID=UPI000C09C7E0|nr:hypothetical protein [Maritimibacter sp. UBA3975]MAM61641.1 hypothetical protein [Maritimibacter sp.]|tara:strand:+ start:12717 stop:13709 length:993 start_codon:yes stop_codon:yes gene_type:complete